MHFFLNDKLKLSGEAWYGNEVEFKEIILNLCEILNCFHFHIDNKFYYSSIGMGLLMQNFKEIDEMTDGVYSDNINAIRILLEGIHAIDWERDKVQKADVLYFHQLNLGGNTQSVNDTSLAEACEFKYLTEIVSIINLKYSEYNNEEPININRSLINPPRNMDILSISGFDMKNRIIDFIIANRNRTYNHNPKHGENNLAKHNDDNISPLECSIEEATNLLKFAVTTRSKNELYVFDEKNDKYLIYKSDSTNSYHGYHPINQNEVPKSVKEFLSI